jgi:hypothetical protein
MRQPKEMFSKADLQIGLGERRRSEDRRSVRSSVAPNAIAQRNKTMNGKR